MHVSWKAIGTRVRIGNWPPMVWATLALILVCVAGTVIVGAELYAVTEHSPQFSTR